MKKICLFVVFVLNALTLNAQNNCCIARLDMDGSIVFCGDVIDELDPENLTKNKTVSIMDSYNVAVNGTHYRIAIGGIENWDNYDGGLFNVVRISKDEDLALELRRPDCWTWTYGGKSETNFKDFTNNRYCVPVQLNKDLVIVVFIGWPYGGEAPMLTIVALTDKEAKLVFNRKMAINSIRRDVDVFDMIIQDSIVECDNRMSAKAKLFHIYWCGKSLLYEVISAQ